MARIDEINAAFKGLQDGLQSFAAQQSISNANDAVSKIREQEVVNLKDQKQIRTIANDLTASLLGLGAPTTAATAAGEAISPAEKGFKTFEEALLNAPEGSDVHKTALKQVAAERTAKGEKTSFDRSRKINNDVASSFNRIDGTNKARNLKGRLQTVIANGNSLRTLIGPDLSKVALDKLAAPQIHEMAATLVRMVKQGQGTETDIRNFVPANIALTTSAIETWLKSSPAAANQSGLAKLMLKASRREVAVARTELTQAMISSIEGQKSVLNQRPETVRRFLATQTGTAIEDIFINKSGSVTTRAFESQRTRRRDLFQKATRLKRDSENRSLPPERRKRAMAARKVFEDKMAINLSSPRSQWREELLFQAMTNSFNDNEEFNPLPPQSEIETFFRRDEED